jgi:hypothetical protein
MNTLGSLKIDVAGVLGIVEESTEAVLEAIDP